MICTRYINILVFRVNDCYLYCCTLYGRVCSFIIVRELQREGLVVRGRLLILVGVQSGGPFYNICAINSQNCCVQVNRYIAVAGIFLHCYNWRVFAEYIDSDIVIVSCNSETSTMQPHGHGKVLSINERKVIIAIYGKFR